MLPRAPLSDAGKGVRGSLNFGTAWRPRTRQSPRTPVAPPPVIPAHAGISTHTRGPNLAARSSIKLGTTSLVSFPATPLVIPAQAGIFPDTRGSDRRARFSIKLAMTRRQLG